MKKYGFVLLLLLFGRPTFCQDMLLHIADSTGGFSTGSIFHFGDTLIIPLRKNLKLTSYDNGKSWAKNAYNAWGGVGSDVFLNSKTVFRSRNREIQKSTDGGKSWQILYSGIDRPILDLALIHVGLVNKKMICLAIVKEDGGIYNTEHMFLDNFEVYRPLVYFEESGQWMDVKTPVMVLPKSSTREFTKGIISGYFDNTGAGALIIHVDGGYMDKDFRYSQVFRLKYGWDSEKVAYPVNRNERCDAALSLGKNTYFLCAADFGNRFKVYNALLPKKEEKDVAYENLKWQIMGDAFKVDTESLAPFTLCRIDLNKIK